MKIEDSPFQFGPAALDKLRRSPFHATDNSLDDLDLAFLDLLTSINETSGGVAVKDPEHAVGLGVKEEWSIAETKKADAQKSDKASNVRYLSPRETEESATQVEEDMMLLKTELGESDVQYLKQVVIPGLPILMGSVPFQSVFPVDKSGNISYKGFDVSPKLAELIEKGYKTGRPIRVELDPNSAVVLKIRDGRVSAEFLSNDKGMVLYMQQELDDLKNRMAAKNLPVGTLEYRHSDPRQQQRQQPDDDESAKD